MENKIENQTSQEAETVVELHALDRLPKAKIEAMLKLYEASIAMETYAKVCFAAIFVLVLIHNIFIAGKSYPIDTYDSIMAIELSIVGVIVLIVFVLAGIAMSKTSELKKNIKDHSRSNKLVTKELSDQFSMLAVYMFGGSGVKVN